MSDEKRAQGLVETRTGAVAADERRDLLRVDDRLLLEYWKVGEPHPPTPLSPEGLSEETLAAIVRKPTAEFLAQGSGQALHAELVPWLMKIDWVLELLLRTLDRIAPQGIAAPALTEVNVSGGGMRFKTSRRFTVQDHLEMEIILPPFASIRTCADIIRVEPQDARGQYTVAVRFTTIAMEDRERLIRYILQRQAARLRERHLDETGAEH